MHVQHAARQRLHVCSFGHRHDIEVPTGEAQDLLSYLHAHHVSAGPPEPFSEDVDRIELQGTLDDAGVQWLLDGWE
jgi:hypothetical protein